MFATLTQSAYIRAVKKLSSYLGHSPATASAEELRRFQLHLVDKGISSITLNATITALRFLFKTTLNRADTMLKMSSVPVPCKLPTVLSRQEVSRLIDAAGNPKYRAALSVAYGAGLRVSEVVAHKISDIDSTRVDRLQAGLLSTRSCLIASVPAAVSGKTHSGISVKQVTVFC